MVSERSKTGKFRDEKRNMPAGENLFLKNFSTEPNSAQFSNPTKVDCEYKKIPLSHIIVIGSRTRRKVNCSYPMHFRVEFGWRPLPPW